MSFIVNAWLERADPIIQIFSRDTGDILLSLDSSAVSRLLEQGEVTVSEFQQKNSLLLALCIYSGLFGEYCQEETLPIKDVFNSTPRVPSLSDEM